MPAMSNRREYPVILRLTHWVGAAAMITMMLSGWAIYNASPLLPFTIPSAFTLGGWLGAGIAWHISAMWVLMADGLIYLGWGFGSGHFRRRFLPISAGSVWRDFRAAAGFRLKHDPGRYNAVQRLLYLLVVGGGVLAVLTGISIWKPVQFGALTWVFGGYDIARRIHFALMCGIFAFLLVHLALVAVVPRTLRAMVLGEGKP
jgi:thiosulfate reductase cytochrome b subunit